MLVVSMTLWLPGGVGEGNAKRASQWILARLAGCDVTGDDDNKKTTKQDCGKVRRLSIPRSRIIMM